MTCVLVHVKISFHRRPSQKCLITFWLPEFPIGTNLTLCFFLHIVYCGLQSQGLPVQQRGPLYPPLGPLTVGSLNPEKEYKKQGASEI